MRAQYQKIINLFKDTHRVKGTNNFCCVVNWSQAELLSTKPKPKKNESNWDNQLVFIDK